MRGDGGWLVAGLAVSAFVVSLAWAHAEFRSIERDVRDIKGDVWFQAASMNALGEEYGLLKRKLDRLRERINVCPICALSDADQ